MIKAGAIVFASADGGQAEILAHPDLLFTDADDAVLKIRTALESPRLQLDLRAHLVGKGHSSSALKHSCKGRKPVLRTP